MLPNISSWSEEKRRIVGLWCSPLLGWSVYAIQLASNYWLNGLIQRHYGPKQISDWWALPAIIAVCAFWLACAAFAGLCAAFFWRDVKMDFQMRESLTFKSVAITWSPTIIMCCAWVVLWIPFLFYLALFRFSVDRGIKFWNSNRPRQWIGDFSDMESPSDN